MNKQEEKFSPLYPLQQNQINVFGPIDTAVAEAVVAQLQYIEDRFKRNNTPPHDRLITIQFNTPGGSVSDGLAIYDTMKFLQRNGTKIAAIGLGMVASMGAVLLSGGTKGYRKVTQNCEILIHQPLGGASGQASDIIIAANHIERMRTRLNNILAANTGKPIEIITTDTDRDCIMTAYEAQAYGLVDDVI